MRAAESWFERHPRKSLIGITIGLALVIDLVAGWIAIPPDYHAFRRPDPRYHHGLRPGAEGTTRWGSKTYRFATNSLGLRDAAPREVPLRSGDRRRVLILGDSFLEGQGVSWEQSVAGLLDDPRREVLNAATVSYSPKLYWLKGRDLLQRVGLEVDELWVFIDISDIHNEILYRSFRPGTGSHEEPRAAAVDRLLRRRSFVYHRIRGGHRRYSFEDLGDHDPEIAAQSKDYDLLAAWTSDDDAQQRYGVEGLRRAADHMQLLSELCRELGLPMTIVVYPWPQQILRRERSSLQSEFWGDFCRRHGCRFIDLFPAFLDPAPAAEVVRAYFIAGDVHWNVAGNRMVAEELERRIVAER